MDDIVYIRPEAEQHLDPFAWASVSNLDFKETDWTAVEAFLVANDVYSKHAGWDFNACIWWDRTHEVFVSQVWQYHVVVDTLTSDDLESLCTDVNERYGWG